MKSFRIILFLLAILSLASLSHAQVVISEFMADNKKTIADQDGAFSDWIEIYNASTTSVNLSGWSLTDDPTHQARWTFPSTNLAAKGYMVIFASGTSRTLLGQPLHTNFKLSANGEYLALLLPNGTAASEFNPFAQQYADISYGIAQNVTTNTLIGSSAPVKVLVPGSGGLGNTWTQNGFNDSAWTSGTTGVGYETSVPGFAVRNFKANISVASLPAAQGVITNPSQQSAVYAENAPVINYVNTGGGANYANDRTFPGLTIGSDVEDFVIEATATITVPSAGSWTFGVNSDDGFILTIGNFSMSYPDPRGPGDTLQTFNFPSAGDYALKLIFYERGGGSEVELYAAQGSFTGWNGTNFRLVGDTVSGGLAVRSQVVTGGSGTGSYKTYIKTDVQSQMNGVNASTYLRVPFTVSNPGSLQSLTLRMMYDDGFIAYVNGQEVARRNAPGSPAWNSAATAAHPNAQAFVFEDINISDFLGSLQAGNNVLAIQGLNQSASDGDFLIVPQLVEYQVSNTSTNYFSTATPGGPNGSGFIAFVADTKFSVDHGFFTNAFPLAITTDTSGATIKYTTDGSTPTLSNGLTYANPITINKTTVVRAAAFKTGFQPSNVDTKTYIFLSDVIHQSPNGDVPTGWPATWGGNVVDYGMDPNVVNNSLYSGTINNDLQTIPSFSIVTDLPNLFDAGTGIYANPSGDGYAWERPASIELIYPDGSKGFHARIGLRVRGGYSRSTDNPKHAFRFFFREEYGQSKLKYPMFESQNGTDEFNGFDLRTFQNYSWSFGGDSRGIFVRDQFSRDTQIDMGQAGERGDYYHLYIDGQYWGLYNTDERPEASYAASYFGGQPEDYDVIKVDPGRGYNIFATDGTMDAWTRLWQAAVNGFASDAAYQKVQGNNPDGSRNPAYEVLLDVDNLIDYMLVIFYGGNLDAPISNFLGNTSPNNWFGFRHTNGLSGFRFVAHDSEHTLLDVNQNRVGPFPAGDPGTGGGLLKSNPQYIFQQLWQNTEFKMHLADRVQKHFFNGGALTPQAARTRFMKRKDEIDRAVVGESARWGDAKTEPPLSRNNQWLTEINRVLNSYLPQRTGIVLNQLKAQSLYPSVTAPSFNQFGGNTASGFQLTITAPAGTIYYTRDGSDPRLRGGAVSSTALTYSSAIPLTQSARIKARALSGGVWSALIDATFYVTQTYTDVLITEIMYHPPSTANDDGDSFEFIELKNVGNTARELSGVNFGNGIDFTFPIGTFIAPGQFLVLVSDPIAFASKYPAVPIAGTYNKKLSNGGETVSLLHVTGTPIVSVQYDSQAPWPVAAAGGGFSLVPVNPNLNPDPNSAANWRASATIGGSPGADDPVPNVLPVYINEALTHTDLPQVDSIELYNPNSSAVSIANWFLTDDRTQPLKFRIPAGDSRATIPAKGYVVFTENDWNADPNSPDSFRLDSHGEEVYLYSADANGSLTGFSDGFAFNASANGVTFGRYVTSTGTAQYPAQVSNSLGAVNAGPRVGPVVINEIQYHPAAGGDEYVELKNITASAVKLYDPAYPTNTWKLKGLGFDFPMNTEIPANGLIVLTATDPTAFRTKYSVAAGVLVLGPYSGVLQDNGETLSLERPDQPDLNTNNGTYYIPYVAIDIVDYSSVAPWPTGANGTGSSLERLQSSAYGNDPINWRASPGAPSPGVDNIGNRPPLVSAGNDQSLAITNVPITLSLAGSATDDGFPNAVLTATWSQVSGPGSVTFGNVSQPATTATFPALGTYLLRLSATDGALQAAATVTITLSQATVPLTFIAKGSVWKYLDDGSNQGTGWSAKTFTDTSWKSGAAELGYGDAAEGRPEVTVIGYGPDANNKYVTTYFRRAFNVTGAASVKNLVVNLMRDDGAVVYLNGTEVFRDNMPATAIDFSTLAINAVGGTDEATFYSQPANPALLVEGVNVLAVEIHQSSRTSSDVSFDLELTGDGVPGNPPPVNQPPAVSAGANQTITLPASAQINGTITDDGLPNPPAQISVSWSKVSGPGSVTFTPANAASTRAGFSVAGTYVLRLTASDSASQTTSDVTIGVLDAPQNAAPVVNAGTTQTIILPASAQLSATVSDDGLPNPPAQLTLGWSKVSGPGNVTFGSPAAAATTATFSAPGTYLLRLTANDSALQTTSDITIRAVQNTAPVVNAGANQTITLPASAQLAGTVTDDGLPNPPAMVTVAWSKLNGPGNVTFSNPAAAATSATFSAAGTYVLRLSATDSALPSTSDVTITVVQNAAPVVSAGANQTLGFPSTVQLKGTATDDGLPNPPGTTTTTWAKISGPGNTTFGNANSPTSTATFSAAGAYVLRLTASDGALQATSDVTITLIQNAAPMAQAGANQTVTLPATAQLTGTAADDGYPNPPGALTITWSKLSGPGNVTFGNASNAATTAAFSQGGTYILRLTANDGSLQTTSDVTITVLQNAAPVVSAGANKTVAMPASVHLQGTITDDGLPLINNAPGKTTVTWSKLIGPAEVTFSDPTSAVTTATFADVGTFVLRLTGSDGALQSTSDVTITVVENTAPVVGAGDDISVILPAAAQLNPTVSDDGFPSGQLTSTWTKISGPGTVTFANANQPNTSASFSAGGTYVLRLAVSDGALEGFSSITVNVRENAAPVVTAGANQSIKLPANAQLTGTVTDDGLPTIPGQVTSSWSKVTGAGSATFANPNSPTTTATFTVPGSYVLRLTATDGALQSSDEVTITVQDTITEPLHIETVSVEVSGQNPTLEFSFRTTPFVSYTIQYRDSLVGGTWQKLRDVTATDTTQMMNITDPSIGQTAKRYYRIVTPLQ